MCPKTPKVEAPPPPAPPPAPAPQRKVAEVQKAKTQRTVRKNKSRTRKDIALQVKGGTGLNVGGAYGDS
jgi:hypothetical protein